MSVMEALQMAGFVSLGLGVLFVALAAHSFVTQDIPMVVDDLSGRKRQRELDALRGNLNAHARPSSRSALKKPRLVMSLAAKEAPAGASTEVKGAASGMEPVSSFCMVARMVSCADVDTSVVEG